MTPDGDTFWPGDVLLTRQMTLKDGSTQPIVIGVVGMLPPQVIKWERRHLNGRALAGDMVEAARDRVPKLRAAGADLVVALCHGGISARAREGTEDGALQVAEIEGVDAVIAGHKHRLFPGADHDGAGIDNTAGTLSGTPAVMAGWRGSHLGVIDLELAHGPEGWRVTGHSAHLRAASETPCPQITTLAAPLTAKADARLAEIVGQSPRALHSYLAHLPGCPALGTIAGAARHYTAGQLAGRGALADLPVIAATGPYKAGGFGGPLNYSDVPAGQIALRHIQDLYPYVNYITAIRTTGAVLRDWMERAAIVFSHVKPGSTGTPLLIPGAYPGLFQHFEGVRYEIDLSADGLYRTDEQEAVGSTPRIRDISVGGQRLRDTDELVLVTTDHKLWGGGAGAAIPLETVLFEGPATMRAVVAEGLADGRVAQGAPTWRFRPIGAEVRYVTGPGAAAHLDDLSGVELLGTGQDDDGFMWLRLRV